MKRLMLVGLCVLLLFKGCQAVIAGGTVIQTAPEVELLTTPQTEEVETAGMTPSEVIKAAGKMQRGETRTFTLKKPFKTFRAFSEWLEKFYKANGIDWQFDLSDDMAKVTIKAEALPPPAPR